MLHIRGTILYLVAVMALCPLGDNRQLSAFFHPVHFNLEDLDTHILSRYKKSVQLKVRGRQLYGLPRTPYYQQCTFDTYATYSTTCAIFGNPR